MVATISPVSCEGKKPFGITMYIATVPATVSVASSSISASCRSAQCRLRP